MNWSVVFLLPVFAASLVMGQPPTVLPPSGLRLPAVLPCTPVKDQGLSSTCWSFSSLSFLESEVLRQGRGRINLSEMFVARHAYVRKIETHLALGGKNFFTPGGQFHDALWVLQHKGLVPEEVYPGKPVTTGGHDHTALDTAISRYVRAMLAAGRIKPNAREYAYIDSVLDHHLGALPLNFNWKGRRFTPQTFAREVLQLDAADYVEITSYTHHPFYTAFILEDKYNWAGDYYYNVPITDFRAIVRYALSKGYTTGWDGDVTEAGFQYESGLACLPDSVADWQQWRQQTFQNGATAIDHMMHIAGITKDSRGRNWYIVKNSWGGYSNPQGGYLFMNEAYFAIKTSAIFVHKAALLPKIRKKLVL